MRGKKHVSHVTERNIHDERNKGARKTLILQPGTQSKRIMDGNAAADSSAPLIKLNIHSVRPAAGDAGIRFTEAA